MNVRVFIVAALFTIIHVKGISQGLPSVIMPNPEPAKIASYGKYEISNFTGKPNISIPLYNIKTTRLELPISVTYEATGVKVSDIASNVGLGFFLNAGGVITKAIVGLPDDYSGGYLGHTPTVNDLLNPTYLFDLAYNQQYDLEPDKYYYNFNGVSGEFSFDVQKNIFNIGMNGVTINRTNDGFNIVDEEGNLYEFTKKEYTTVEVDLDISQPNSVTSWWLTKITSADKSDVMELEYEPDLEEQEQTQSFSQVYGPKMLYREPPPFFGGQPYMESTDGPILESSSSFQKRSWVAQRLHTIKFRNGKVEFVNVKDRQDVINSTRLDRIEIYSKINDTQYAKVKTVKLATDYFHYTGSIEYNSIFYSTTAGKHRLKLLAIEEYDRENNFINKHSFEYDLSSEIPYRGSLVYDYWGYNNGAYINNRAVTLIPAQRTDDNRYNVGGANREPNEQAMKAGILTKITYPTGGSTKFSWEAHRYFYSSQTVQPMTAFSKVYGNDITNTPRPYKTIPFTLAEAQTVAIHSIINYVSAETPYDDPELYDLSQDVYPYVSLVNDDTGQEFYRASYGNALLDVTASRSLPAGNYKLITTCYVNNVNAFASIEVQYTKTVNTTDIRPAGGLRIAGIENYSSNDKLGYKETYKYGANESNYGVLSMPPSMMNTLSYNKKYAYILQYIKANVSRKIYRSEPVASINLSGGSSVVYPVVTKYIGNNQTNIGKTIFQYHYQYDISLTSYPSGTNEEFVVTRYPWRTGYLTDQKEYKNENNNYTLVRHTHNDYTELGVANFQSPKAGFVASPAPVGAWPGASIFTAEDYYRTSYPTVKGVNQLTSSSTTEYNLSGDSLKSTTTYSYDPLYNKFLTSQISINSKGESIKVVNKYPFDKEQITGLNAANKTALDRMMEKNIISPVVETQTFKDNTFLERIRTNYQIWNGSQSNTGSVIKPQSLERQVLTLPSEIIYRLLNYDDSGNILEQAKKSDISSVYLWGYSNSYPLAEIKNSTFTEVLSALGLTQLQLESTAAVTFPSTDYLNRIANLRTGLPKALITTYTYKPLEGLKSVTDPNGNTTSYEYDPAGRLQYMRDKDNNIIKSYEYKYQNR